MVEAGAKMEKALSCERRATSHEQAFLRCFAHFHRYRDLNLHRNARSLDYVWLAPHFARDDSGSSGGSQYAWQLPAHSCSSWLSARGSQLSASSVPALEAAGNYCARPLPAISPDSSPSAFLPAT